MAYLEEFSFNTPKLLVFCLGGHTEKGKLEIHDATFLVAKTDKEATTKIQQEWSGTPRSLHVDSWIIAEYIDGYHIEVSQSQPAKLPIYLYFVNLGFYLPSQIGEHHFMTLVVAKNKKEAMKKAEEKCPQGVEMLHLDDVHELDGCIRIHKVDSFFVRLNYIGTEVNSLDHPINGYQNLRK